MDRMKTFRTYLILFILFYIYVSVMSYFFVKSTYYNMDYKINVESPKVIVTDARASRVNGHIEGKIQNNTDSTFEKGYIRFELISKAGNSITNKYIEIAKMNPKEEKEFSINFHAENIVNCNISYVEDSKEFKIDSKFKANAIEFLSAAAIILTSIKFLKFIL